MLGILSLPSTLDDREHYKDPKSFKTAPTDRAKVTADAAYTRQCVEAFGERDPGFWEVFKIFTNFVLCVDSKYSFGGTISTSLGVIVLVDPKRLSESAFYELLVHESTPLMMFVDEAQFGHYQSYERLAEGACRSKSVVYEYHRTIDKVLHSIVVATEVPLHRDKVLGHETDTRVHPATPKLAASTLASIDELLALQSRIRLLAPRGVWLVKRCRQQLLSLAAAQLAPPRAEPLSAVAILAERTTMFFILGKGRRPIDADVLAAVRTRRDRASLDAKRERLRDALEGLAATNGELGEVFALLINRVFVVELDGQVGGSIPKHLGVIWANPPPTATRWDIIEYLVHEMTHTAFMLRASKS